MKNLTKLFVAVAVLAASFACTTDATNDLGVAVGDQTTITLSLEESRTQLGEKTGTIYPLYWSEGDKISVNGVESDALSISGNATTASFTIPAKLSAPYCIVYPTAPAGQVLFAGKQTHADNTTFGSGVSTMYAYSPNSIGAELHHLTGVLKIGVVGSATLTKAVISTSDRTPIAGAFDIDFASGAVTPSASATSVIEYEFAEPVALSNEATYMHIAVPAGTYDEMYVTLYDNVGGVMFATIKADESKPLTAGGIRIFSGNIKYTANTKDTVISNADELIAWGTSAASSTKNAVLVADIDMTGKSWTSVGDFGGSFIGNGFAIKGLKAPLFGISNVPVIKGVHLVDVNMTITTNPDAGALICDITNKDTEISHCSVTGKMTININKPKANHSYNYYAAMIGYTITGKELHDLYTNVEITVASTSVSSSHMYITHLAGRGGTTEENYLSLRNVVCHGTIYHNGGTGSGHLYLGGVVVTGVAKMNNCVVGKPNSDGKSGSITVGSTHAKNTYCGGMSTFLNTYTTVENCHNYGNITVGSSAGAIYIGGLVHSARGGSLTDCSHHGDITITSKKPTATYWAGGIVSSDDGGAANQVNTFTRCNNYGNIEYTSNVEAKYYNAGGLMARRETKGNSVIFDSCNNHGNITVKGIIINSSHIGGLIGLIGAANAAPKAVTIKNCTNYGAVTINSKLNLIANDGTLRVGDAIGTLVHPLQDVDGYIRNEGKVTCTLENNSDATAESLCIGGFIGYTTPSTGWLNTKNLKLHNCGDIEVKFVNGTDFTNPTLGGIGGIIGYIGSPGYISNASCNCKVIAVGLTGRVGIFAGSAYDVATSVVNCKVAGAFVVELDEEDETEKSITLDESNFANYLYCKPIDKEIAEAAGLTYQKTE